MLRYLSAALAVALASSLGVAAAEGVLKKTENGTPKIQSISAIAFDANGTLLIGDSTGGQIVAIDTKDTKAKPWKASAIEKIDEKIASKLGTKASNVEIVSMVVNRAS